MKILEPGNPEPEKPLVKECPHCGCKFEYSLEDAEVMSSPFISLRVLTCPQEGCNRRIYF